MIFSTPNEVDSDEETFETKFEGDLLEDDDEYAEDEKDAAELRWGEILKELGGAPSSLFNTDDKLTESRQNEQEFENTRKEFTQEFIEDDDDQDEEFEYADFDISPDEIDSLDDAEPDQEDWQPEEPPNSDFNIYQNESRSMEDAEPGQSGAEKYEDWEPEEVSKSNKDIALLESRDIDQREPDQSGLENSMNWEPEEPEKYDPGHSNVDEKLTKSAPHSREEVPESRKFEIKSQGLQHELSERLNSNSSYTAELERRGKLKIIETTMDREIFGNLLITAARASNNFSVSRTAKAIQLFM